MSLANKFDQAKGAVKEGVGKVTGDNKTEAEGFVESKFGGSLKNFLVAFRGSDKISKKDMNDLKAWLDEFDN